MDGDKAFVFHMCIPCGMTFLWVYTRINLLSTVFHKRILFLRGVLIQIFFSKVKFLHLKLHQIFTLLDISQGPNPYPAGSAYVSRSSSSSKVHFPKPRVGDPT